MPLELQAIDDAAFICRKEGMTAKSRQRDRRPTIGELDQLLEFYGAMRLSKIPMAEVVLFALFSSRRQDEICRIRWEDVDEGKQRVLVRDMKHPRERVDTWVDIPGRPWEVQGHT